MIRVLRSVLLLSMAVVFVVRAALMAQSAQFVMMAQAQVPPIGSEQHPDTEMERKRQRDLERAANKEREARLKRDTDKLLELATELKLYVDKSNENVLSLEVIKKADEIEKLAKSVKDKMKGN